MTANQHHKAFTKLRADITAINRILSLGMVSNDTQHDLTETRKALAAAMETQRQAYLNHPKR